MALPFISFLFGTGIRSALSFGARGAAASFRRETLLPEITFDVRRFNKQLLEFNQVVFPRAYVVMVADQAREALRGLHSRTPVGMPETWKKGRAPAGYTPGRAKGNWQVTVGSPPVREKFKEDPVAAGMAVIDGWEKKWSRRVRSFEGLVRRLPDIHVANVVPYIERLETGWSDQAPAGMLSLTVREMEASL